MMSDLRPALLLIVPLILALVDPVSAQTPAVEITKPEPLEDVSNQMTYLVEFKYTLPSGGRAQVTTTRDDGGTDLPPEQEVLPAADMPTKGSCTIVLPQPDSGQILTTLITVQLLDSDGKAIKVNGQDVQEHVNVTAMASGPPGG